MSLLWDTKSWWRSRILTFFLGLCYIFACRLFYKFLPWFSVQEEQFLSFRSIFFWFWWLKFWKDARFPKFLVFALISNQGIFHKSICSIYFDSYILCIKVVEVSSSFKLIFVLLINFWDISRWEFFICENLYAWSNAQISILPNCYCIFFYKFSDSKKSLRIFFPVQALFSAKI